MNKKEKMIVGYWICVKNMLQTIVRKERNAFIPEAENRYGKELVWSPWVRLGGCVPFIFHPVLAARYLKASSKQ